LFKSCNFFLLAVDQNLSSFGSMSGNSSWPDRFFKVA
jgi:hypothetical protein